MVFVDTDNFKNSREKLDFSNSIPQAASGSVHDKGDEKHESTEESHDRLDLQLDNGVVKIRKRDVWWKIWLVDVQWGRNVNLSRC
jgi:hypothetical protein